MNTETTAEERVKIHHWVMGKGPKSLTRREATAMVAQTRRMTNAQLREFYRQKWIDAGSPG